MTKDAKNLIVGLDIGTSKVVAVVAEVLPNGRHEVIGLGQSESKGLKKGVVVNVVGNGGKSPSVLHISGGSANAALMLASAGLAAAYAPHGVRVNAVNPAATATDRLMEGMKVAAKHDNISIEQAIEKATARVPMGRLASPEEVADTVVYLSSSRASYVTGTTIEVTGGR